MAFRFGVSLSLALRMLLVTSCLNCSIQVGTVGLATHEVIEVF